MKYTKVIIVTLFCIGFVLGSVSLTFGQGGAPPYAGLNYEKIALLKWYPAAQTGATFTAGTQPNGLAFDGAHIWVTNFGDGTVTKLLAADGTNFGTFTVGTHPQKVAFDGAYIWVTYYGAQGGKVSKLWAANPNDPDHLPKTFSVGHDPRGVAFDGANIWVANFGDGTVTKLAAADGTNLGTFPVGVDSALVAFDGSNIWATGLTQTGGIVTKLRVSDGMNLGTFNVGAGYPDGITFDGANIWVASFQSGTVFKLRTSNGATLGTSSVNQPGGLVFDGTYIWVTSAASVVQLRASDGAMVGGPFSPGDRCINACTDLAFDGAYIWVNTDQALGKL